MMNDVKRDFYLGCGMMAMGLFAVGGLISLSLGLGLSNPFVAVIGAGAMGISVLLPFPVAEIIHRSDEKMQDLLKRSRIC